MYKRDSLYKKTVKEEIELHTNIEATDREKLMMEQLLARQLEANEGPLMHAMTEEQIT